MPRQSAIRLLAIAACIAAFPACDDSSSGPKAPADQGRPTAQGQRGITVLAPNGGETFVAGSDLRVEWSYSPDSLSSARVLLSCNGADWADLTSSSLDLSSELADPATFDSVLTIPDSVYSRAQTKKIALTGTACKVKVQDYQMTYNFDTSDASFAVNAR